MNFSVRLLMFLFALALTADGSENWYQFRGPQGNGLSREKSLPIFWSETSNVVWKTAIHGRGWSSPVIWSNQVWMTTATEEGTRLYAVCVDRETGKIVHDLLLFEVATPSDTHRFNSFASPTPVIEAGFVYVTFGSAGTACLNSNTGEKVWERRDLECNHGRGAGSSPVLFLDRLIMHFDGMDQQYVVALNKKTGATLWKTPRSMDFKDLTPEGKPLAGGDWRKAFSTPTIMLNGSQFLVLSLGSKAFYAYDFVSGSELWRTEEETSHSGTVRPLVGKDMIYVATGLAKGQLWAIKANRVGTNPPVEVMWRVYRNVPTRPSPILLGDHLYMVDDGGIATCLEAKTGTEIWRERIGGNFSASPIAIPGAIYFLNEEGGATVVAAQPAFKILAQNKLDNGFMASPAVYNRSLYLRTKSHLYRIEDKENSRNEANGIPAAPRSKSVR